MVFAWCFATPTSAHKTDVDSMEKINYKIGDVVPQSGMYICVPCGYAQHFEVGSTFTTCEACFAGTTDGPDGYQDSENEFWQLLA